MESSPALLNGVVFVGADNGSVTALNGTTGSIKWTSALGGSIESTPAVVAFGSWLYVGSTNGNVYALSAANGALRWQAPSGGSITSSPAVIGTRVFIGSGDGYLEAFNSLGCVTSPCSPLWTSQIGSSVTSSPAIAGGVVYVGSTDGSLYAFSAADCGTTTCSPLWIGSTGASIESSPAVANGQVYVGTDAGNLISFGLLSPPQPPPKPEPRAGIEPAPSSLQVFEALRCAALLIATARLHRSPRLFPGHRYQLGQTHVLTAAARGHTRTLTEPGCTTDSANGDLAKW